MRIFFSSSLLLLLAREKLVIMKFAYQASFLRFVCLCFSAIEGRFYIG